MNPFSVDRAEFEEASRILWAMIAVSIFGALACIAIYFGWSSWAA